MEFDETLRQEIIDEIIDSFKDSVDKKRKYVARILYFKLLDIAQEYEVLENKYMYCDMMQKIMELGDIFDSLDNI